MDPNKSSNDEVDAAALIGSFPYTVTQDTTRATSASDDPDMGDGLGPGSNSVWYRLVAPGGGSIRASTSGSSYDTVLAAFTGSRGSLSLVASNDDAGSSTYQSEVTFNVQPGTTYFLEITGYGDTGGGTLQLRVEYSNSAAPTATPTPTYTSWVWPTSTSEPTPTPGVAPPNDDIDSATTIEQFPFTSSEDIGGATTAGDDPIMGDGLGVNSNSVWYRLVAPGGGSIRASTSGSSYDTVLAAFTGSRGSLSLVASNDDAGSSTYQSEVTFNVQPGTTYYIEVAQYGSPSSGTLNLTVEWSADAVVGTITPTPSPFGTPGATGTPGMPGTVGAAAQDSLAHPASNPADPRYFSQTGFRVGPDSFWDYFNKRGGVRTFGYPISWEFPLLGFRVQMFQRAILQLMPDGSVATMNLLDDGLMPYNRIDGSKFPLPERDLIEAAPSPLDPDYGEKAIAFVQANVPDQWEGLPSNFLQTFMTTVRYEEAFPDGQGDPALVPLLDLEIWGLPTSRPAYDPTNRAFVYQRFQRGIMMYDASTGRTQGLLLADYLKSLMTGQGLPADLAEQGAGSRFYRQYDRTKPGWLASPEQLPGTNLEGAFQPMVAQAMPTPTFSPTPTPTPTATLGATPTVRPTRTPTPSATPTPTTQPAS